MMDPSGLVSLIILTVGCAAWAWAIRKGPAEQPLPPPPPNGLCNAKMPPGVGIEATCGKPFNHEVIYLNPWHEEESPTLLATWRTDGTYTRVRNLHQRTPKETA